MKTPALMKHLKDLRAIPENWDGRGARSPDDALIAMVGDFCAELPMVQSGFKVTENGGITVVFQGPKHRLELDFESIAPWLLVWSKCTAETDRGTVKRCDKAAIRELIAWVGVPTSTDLVRVEP